MNLSYFETEIAPRLTGFVLTYESFPEGDFGALERIDLKGSHLIGTLDFWSQGWLDICVYDLRQDKVLINSYYKPERSAEQREALQSLLKVLVDKE